VTRQSLWFEGSGRVSLREEALEPPGPGEVLLESSVSAISAGTEMLFYHGEIEEGAAVDSVLEGYRRELSYPLRYGYASVGRITQTGHNVDPGLEGRLAFAFTPHATASCIAAEAVIPVPDGIAPEEAAFLATAETAVNLVLDSRPLLGERASVFGLGVIGLLTAGLLARFPLASLRGWDLHALRREMAASFGVTAADPRETPPGAGTEDLSVEASGTASGFRLALSSCGFSGRVVVGSWYGTGARKQAFDAFDTAFHRNRVRIVSSQVSTIDPSLTGRWTRERRRGAAWDVVRSLRPGRLITHRIPFSRAAEAYRLLAESQGQTIQVMLVHGKAGTLPHAPGQR
jgi:2-desacetyl-2-hydroxyethyl bacteriochlorophyllide A dehydrogenase